MNIYSGSSEGGGLAAALTNPTELAFRKGRLRSHYPVSMHERVFADAETAYQVLKEQYVDDADRDRLMAEIIAAKFKQHPRLFQKIAEAGGTPFLEQCSHFTYARSARFQRWEGQGRESRFIRNLIAGYELALNASR